MDENEKVKWVALLFGIVVALILISFNLALLWSLHEKVESSESLEGRIDRMAADVDMATALYLKIIAENPEIKAILEAERNQPKETE